MSLRKKIILSFLISSTITAVIALSAYVTFHEIRKEIRSLELSDTLRSKTLQLRRHEKNFFIYRDPAEQELVHDYILQIRDIIAYAKPADGAEQLAELNASIDKYESVFSRIESLTVRFQNRFDHMKNLRREDEIFFPLIESTVLERPLVNARLLGSFLPAGAGADLISILNILHNEIATLRKTGEELINQSKDLDRSARERADRAIDRSQMATLLLFPLFLVVGLAALFIISQSVVNRLKILQRAIEKTGRGAFLSLAVKGQQDEVGVLMKTFNEMEDALIERDREITKKSEELLQSRKLASIGTLASGVAHELNNPLNNIYLAAQILSKEIEGGDIPPLVRETVEDIFSQTLRVKRIVGDLLAFSREKVPELAQVSLISLVEDVLSTVRMSGMLKDISLDIDVPWDVEVMADAHLMEQVLINLVSNSVDAMEGEGRLSILVGRVNGSVKIEVSDTGTGIPQEDLSRIFDPFFSKKEKGTGLGLAIVYNIVRKHNGTIEVKSVRGEGTAFTITLPGVS